MTFWCNKEVTHHNQQWYSDNSPPCYNYPLRVVACSEMESECCPLLHKATGLLYHHHSTTNGQSSSLMILKRQHSSYITYCSRFLHTFKYSRLWLILHFGITQTFKFTKLNIYFGGNWSHSNTWFLEEPKYYEQLPNLLSVYICLTLDYELFYKKIHILFTFTYPSSPMATK